jgi:uncharacterized protein YbaR (Trm112 family)
VEKKPADIVEEIIICPECHGELEFTEEGRPEYHCLKCGNSYRIEDGIPVFLQMMEQN